MPNWSFLFTNFVYHLGLTLWIGGTIALGALVAPALFRSLPRLEAGGLFGPMLRRFARLQLAALIAVVIAAAVKAAVWESGAVIWIAVRWAALIVMAATVLYEIAVLEKTLEARRAHLTPEMAEEHPERRAFNALHKRAEGLAKIGFAAALVALLMS
jgi:uncharacterized membrane protein